MEGLKVFGFIGIFFLLISCGVGTSTGSRTPTTDQNTDVTSTSNNGIGPQCCKICSSGIACGSTCIEAGQQCDTPYGCACNGKPSFKMHSSIPLIGIARIPSYAGYGYSSGSESGTVDEEGRFTFEKGIEVVFRNQADELIKIENPETLENN